MADFAEINSAEMTDAGSGLGFFLVEFRGEAALVAAGGVFVQGRGGGGLVEGFVDALELFLGVFDAAVEDRLAVFLNLGAVASLGPTVAGAGFGGLDDAFLGGGGVGHRGSFGRIPGCSAQGGAIGLRGSGGGFRG